MTERAEGTKGVELIRRERERQVADEGYTAEHDDTHLWGEMAVQAARLAAHGTDAWVEHPDDDWGCGWPHWYDLDAIQGMSELRRLVIAGALIAAEIDRLQRLETPDD